MNSEDQDHAPNSDTPGHLGALDDMEAIFGRPEPGRRAAPVANLPALRPRRRRAPAALIAGLVAIIALGLIFLVRTPGQSEARATRASPPAMAAVPQMGTDQAAMAALRQETVAATATPPADAAPAAQVAAVTDIPRFADASPITTAPQPVTVDPPPSERPAAIPAVREPGRGEDVAYARHADPCARGSDDPDCVDTALRRADFALRRAYYAAQAAGVAPDALRHYRREWSRVRDYASDDPEGTIDNYRGMTRDLNDLARDRDAS